MTASHAFYQDHFPFARIYADSGPGACPSREGSAFTLELCTGDRHRSLRAQTGPGGVFCPEQVPLEDGTGRTLQDLAAEATPEHPWGLCPFSVTVRPDPGQGCGPARIDGCCHPSPVLTPRGEGVLWRGQPVPPLAEAVFSPGFFTVRGGGRGCTSPLVPLRVPMGQPLPFRVELTGDALRACLMGRCTHTRLPAPPQGQLGFVFTLPAGGQLQLSGLSLNGTPLPDAGSCRPGRSLALLPGDRGCCAGALVLTGHITFLGRAGTGEGFSLAAALFPVPCAHFPGCGGGEVQLRALKRVVGGPLRPGQFEFVAQRPCGTVVARGRNDAAGWVHLALLPDRPLQPQGEWLVLRELAPRHPLPGWKMDSTRYRVFVRPCDGTVIYEGAGGVLEGVPVFVNRLRRLSSVGGMCRTPQGRPVPGTRVLLHREGDRPGCAPLRSQLTDCRGRYSFGPLPRGRYRLCLQPREGWQSVGCTGYAVCLEQEPVTGMDFILQRDRPPCLPCPGDGPD